MNAYDRAAMTKMTNCSDEPISSQRGFFDDDDNTETSIIRGSVSSVSALRGLSDFFGEIVMREFCDLV